MWVSNDASETIISYDNLLVVQQEFKFRHSDILQNISIKSTGQFRIVLGLVDIFVKGQIFFSSRLLLESTILHKLEVLVFRLWSFSTNDLQMLSNLSQHAAIILNVGVHDEIWIRLCFTLTNLPGAIYQ